MMKYLVIIVLVVSVHLSSYGINLQQTRRSQSLTFEKLDDARSYHGHVRNDYNWILTLGGSYVDAPLTVKDSGNSSQLQEIVQGMYGVHIGAGYYFKPWLMLGVETAYNQFKDNNNDRFRGFSDPQLKARFRFYNKNRLAFAIAPYVNINLDNGEFTLRNTISNNLNGIKFDALSDQGIGWGVNLIGEYVFNRVQFVANLGYQNSNKAIVLDNSGAVQIDYRQTLLTGIGVYIPFSQAWGINVEMLRQWSFDLFNDDQERNEFFIGAAGGLTQNIHGYAGVGLGNLFDNTDGNDYRLSLGIKIIGGEKYKKKTIKAIVADRQPCEEYFVVRFPTDKSTIYEGRDHQFVKYLRSLGQNNDYIESVYVNGHTSMSASKSYNIRLARKRAINTKKLLAKYGVNANKIHISFFGEEDILSQENGEKSIGASENRRAEVKVRFNSCVNGVQK